MLGERLKNARVRLRLTQREVCIGICDRSLLSQIENDRVSPSLDLLSRLCNRLGTSVSAILHDDYAETDSSNLKFLSELIGYKDYLKVIRHGKALLSHESMKKKPGMHAECLRLVGVSLHRLGRYEESDRYFEQAYKMCMSYELSHKERYLNAYSASLISLGQFEQAFDILKSLYDMFDIVHIHERVKIKVLYNLAKVGRNLGNNEVALRYAIQGIELCKKSGIYESEGALETIRGLLLLDANRIQSAVDSFERALHFFEFTHDPLGIMGCLINIHQCLTMSGDEEGSIKAYQRVLLIAEQHPEFAFLIPDDK